MDKRKINYWYWFFKGYDDGPGYKKLVDKWLIAHFFLAIILALLSDISPSDAANAVLLPLAGIFIGLTFAWGGNVQALMQTEEIKELAENHPGGLPSYIFDYQTAILTILITLVMWGMAGLELFDFSDRFTLLKFPSEVFLYFLASMTLRECWHVVLSAQYMLLYKKKIEDLKKKNPPTK